MSKKESKAAATEAQLLQLLKKVLPKATTDAALAGKIYQAIEDELRASTRAVAFQKLCTRLPLTDLEPETIQEMQTQLAASFADGDVTVQPNKKDKTLSVEVSLPDGTQFTSEIKVNPNAKDEDDGEPEIAVKYIPCPIALPGDPELVWFLAKRENMTPDEADVALSKLQEDFWASKTGQKLQRDRVEKSFPEFIARAPAGMLGELGLKRHYKLPEPVKILHVLAKQR